MEAAGESRGAGGQRRAPACGSIGATGSPVRGVTAWIGGALGLALASLPFARALAFDPSAWVVWGRELWTLSLDTSGGPSWKPLPVLLTAPFAALGDAAPWAWLVVARAAALLAVAGVARLAWRASGPAAGMAAGAVVLLSPWWLTNAALGNVDPLLAALVAWGLLAHADGHERAAFGLAVAAALVRPEAWPFAALYALWLVRGGALSWRVVLGASVAVLALWIVPDLLASELRSLRGATDEPSAGSAKLADVPFVEVFRDLGEQSPWLALALAPFGALLAARWPGEKRALDPWLWLAAALAYTSLVAVMAQAGFAGNPRYLVPALGLVAAAAGSALRPRRLPPWSAWLAAAALVAGVAASTGDDLSDQRRELDRRADARAALGDAIDAAGGRARLDACGPVVSGPGQRTLVAELLRESIPAAGARPRAGDATAVPRPDGRWLVRPPGSC